jgi:hypothetical protein
MFCRDMTRDGRLTYSLGRQIAHHPVLLRSVRQQPQWQFPHVKPVRRRVVLGVTATGYYAPG